MMRFAVNSGQATGYVFVENPYCAAIPVERAQPVVGFAVDHSNSLKVAVPLVLHFLQLKFPALPQIHRQYFEN